MRLVVYLLALMYTYCLGRRERVAFISQSKRAIRSNKQTLCGNIMEVMEGQAGR